MTEKRKDLPPGYTTNYGGASAEGDWPGGEGWFYIPSEKPTVFYKTEQKAIDAAWKEHKCVG